MNARFFINSQVEKHYGAGNVFNSTRIELMLMSDYVFEGKECVKSRTGKFSETKMSNVFKTFEGVIICRPLPMKDK